MNSNCTTATVAKASSVELPAPDSKKSPTTGIVAGASSNTTTGVSLGVTTTKRTSSSMTQNISIQQKPVVSIHGGAGAGAGGRRTTSLSIKERIRMFGGEVPKPPLVQKRKEQLSKKWEKDATKKVATYGVCGRTGRDFTIIDLVGGRATKNGGSPCHNKTVEWYTSPTSGVYRKRSPHHNQHGRSVAA